MKIVPLILIAGIMSLLLLTRKVRKDALFTLSLACLVVLVAASMILYPEPSFQAAARGLGVWWEAVLPALLPFFIAAELLMGMGVVHFMGVLCEPIMRPVFNVPGAGSFTMVMGIASGYPLGAALSARLVDDKLATRTEAERLMCFCNTSDPLFMTGAVAVAMLKRPDVAGIIIAAHYLSAIIVGVGMRFWRRSAAPSPPIRSEGSFLVTRAYRAMRRAQTESNAHFGELLGEAVRKSINTLLSILGFMVLFSVIFELLKIAGITSLVSATISRIVPESLIPSSLHDSLVSGFFEITIGTSMASRADAPLVARVAACGAIIAWSGLSVHAQVAAVIQPSGLSVLPYTIARFFQGILAAAITVLIMKPDSGRWSLPAFEPHVVTGSLAWFQNLGAAAKTCAALVVVIALAAFTLAAWDLVRQKVKR